MEEKIIHLIAQDRIEIPLSSMYQKTKKSKATEAKDLASLLSEMHGEKFVGERVFAYVKTEDKERARGMKEAIAEFCEEFPKYGKILQGKIAEKRVIAEEHLYFGVNPNKRLCNEDYLEVMRSLGLTESTARALYPELIEISRKLSRAREEERSVIVGKYTQE